MSIANDILLLLEIIEKRETLSENDISRTRALLNQAESLHKKAASILLKAAENEKGRDDESSAMLAELCFSLESYGLLNETEKRHRQREMEESKKERIQASTLSSNGTTYTNSNLHTIAGHIVANVRHSVGDIPLIAKIWPYRSEGMQAISFDLYPADNLSQAVCLHSVTATGMLSGEITSEPCVYDMAEGLHLVSLVVRSLKATTLLGRTASELNPDLLTDPLQAHSGAGHINLWVNDEVKR